jgi:shikimate kinase
VNVVLIGLRGTGKSTCGRLLSTKLNRAFVDTDELIQERSGQSIREIFEVGGEPHFRVLETAVVRQVAMQKGLVIATGGGAILDEGNVNALRQNGYVIHLSASPDELWRRIEADTVTREQRPSLSGGKLNGRKELEKLLLTRSGAYSKARHVEVRVEGRSPDQIVSAIMLLLRANRIIPKEQVEP